MTGPLRAGLRSGIAVAGEMKRQVSSQTLTKGSKYMHNFDDSGMKRSIDRRSFLGITGAAAAATLAGVLSTPAVAEPSAQAHVSGRRKLGSLEVSTIGLGVQNMSRQYETIVPYRPEMIDIIRAAYYHGELKELNASVSSIQTQGKRLPAGVLALWGVEAPPKS